MGADRVAYVMNGFPRLSETFIAHEIHQLERLGLGLRLYSIKREREPMAHPAYAALFARAVDRAVCLVQGNETSCVLYPLVLRPLADGWAWTARWRRSVCEGPTRSCAQVTNSLTCCRMSASGGIQRSWPWPFAHAVS